MNDLIFDVFLILNTWCYSDLDTATTTNMTTNKMYVWVFEHVHGIAKVWKVLLILL